VQYSIILRLLRQEGTSFQDVTDIWKPTQLLLMAQVHELLQDMQGRYNEASAATEEFQTLRRSDRYFKQLLEMRLALREAHFQWKANQVRFLTAASKFYSNFGAMLRFLRWELQRGTFNPHRADKMLKGV
jgi:hypothetical protein